MPNIQTAEQVLERPRPKSDPPRPPGPGSNDEIIDAWGEEYQKWADQNSHLPNLFPVDKMVERFKQRNQQPNNPNLQNPQQPNAVNREEQQQAPKKSNNPHDPEIVKERLRNKLNKK